MDIRDRPRDRLNVYWYPFLSIAQVQGDRERLQSLSSRLLETQERERRHLAYELHDEIGQALTAVKINLQACQRSQPTAADNALALQDSITLVDSALQQVRNLSLDLRPSLLDDLDLLAALRWYLDRHSQRTQIPITLICGIPKATHGSLGYP